MLVDILREIRAAGDASRLFAELGYTPADEPYENGAHIVARWGRFRVVAIDSETPREAARLLARTLARSGERALAVAVDPTELALAAPKIGGPGSTKVLVVPLVSPERLTLQQLEDLRPARRTTALGHSLRVAELLTTEAAGERFFTAFRVITERMAASLDRRHSAADRRMSALLALTRVLFLYFVQAKGWLDGRQDFLRALLDTTFAKRRHFHRSALQPLFFNTLNCPPQHRSRPVRLGQIPYLNGGLFERHPVERRLRSVCFSNALWRDAFDTVFERFRFCVREADEVDAVAPDMLGRVFERLMDDGTRHQSGTFYTPESVVRQVVDATLETALGGVGGLSPAIAQRVVSRTRIDPANARLAGRALRELRILDPAAGSGAFLLGALDSLTEMRLSIASDRRPHARCHMRKEILRENLFGVDLDPVAVRLAELRLWLAVVADDPTQDIAAVGPLPNLDGVVRQGDTLLDPIGAAVNYHGGVAPSGTRSIATAYHARRKLFDARGNEQRLAVRALRAAELRLARDALEQASKRTDYALRELAAVASSRDLFGRRTGLTSAQRLQSRALETNRTELEASRGALQDGVVPFFAFEVHAPDAMAAGGFGVVVGNPPWVRAERLSPARRRTLQERFKWWRSGGNRGYAHLPDLAVAFLERALELTAPGGAVGLLLPSKVATAGYGETARSHLVREATLIYVHRVPESEAARFGATTYPLALVVRNERPEPRHSIQLDLHASQKLSQSSLATGGPWILVPDRARDALEHFRESGQPLGKIAPPALGVKTGADRILVGTLVQQAGGVALVRFGDREVQIEYEILRPALRGRDVRAFTARPARVLLWAYDAGVNPSISLPRLAARYIRSQSARLNRRVDYRGGPVWTLFRTKSVSAEHRVVWADIARRPQAVALDETEADEAVPLNTCYVAPAPYRETALVIAAVLNSTWTTALVAASADEARGGYRRINATATSRIPIPVTGSQCTGLADLSARAHGGEPVRGAELDEAVAHALDLPQKVQDSLRTLAADHLRAAARR